MAIAFCHQAENFLLEAFDGSKTSVKTLAGKDREFDFDHVEPTGIHRCIVHVKLFAQGEGFGRWQERIERAWRMKIEIILDKHHLFRIRVVDGFEVAHKLDILASRAALADFHHPLPRMRLKGDQQMTDAMPFIMMVIAPRFARFHGNRHQGIAQQLTRALIKTPERAFGSVGWAYKSKIFSICQRNRGVNCPIHHCCFK